jgi:hypothetical protein
MVRCGRLLLATNDNNFKGPCFRHARGLELRAILGRAPPQSCDAITTTTSASPPPPAAAGPPSSSESATTSPSAPGGLPPLWSQQQAYATPYNGQAECVRRGARRAGTGQRAHPSRTEAHATVGAVLRQMVPRLLAARPAPLRPLRSLLLPVALHPTSVCHPTYRPPMPLRPARGPCPALPSARSALRAPRRRSAWRRRHRRLKRPDPARCVKVEGSPRALGPHRHPPGR